MKLLEKLFCRHNWKGDYEAYGWDKNGKAINKGWDSRPKTDYWLPESLLDFKKCSKCGKSK